MPQLFGRHYTRADLVKRVGRLDQLAGITPVELLEGRSRGVRAFNVATGSGFAFTAIADRALDVAAGPALLSAGIVLLLAAALLGFLAAVPEPTR